MQKTENLNIRETVPLIAPLELHQLLPMDEVATQTVVEGRNAIQKILNGEDDRLIAILGPCSIHDTDAALEYARRLKDLSDKVSDTLVIVMRVYFEKPRTTVGWKGFINDPFLDDSCDISTGLREARRLLVQINAMGLPAATEFLDPIVPQYIADLITWAAIGARTTESQTHRQMASGLSMPVGFKNGTDGNIQVAIDALTSARNAHHFVGMDMDGRTCIVKTKGNPYGHVVLRGGRAGTNFDSVSTADAVGQLSKSKLAARLVVDCSHGNANKRYELQEAAWDSIVKQRVEGNRSLMGVMVESNLNEGNQKIPGDRSLLRYGVSVTDECISWEATERIVRHAHTMMQSR
jgi:3-deoxy-7-phosphoheptulonate synthase